MRPSPSREDALQARVTALEATVASLLARPAQEADRDLLTLKDAAHTYNRSIETVRRWARGPAGVRVGGRLYLRPSLVTCTQGTQDGGTR